MPPLVSVVTPFHNTAQYLEECIQSVLRQSCSSYEYVLVDNVSTDGSYEIARRYAASHGQVRLLQTGTLLSQVENYNFALRQIDPNSKYCKIVQADDWIYPECLLTMVDVAEADSDIGLISSYTLTGTNVGPQGMSYQQRVMTGLEAGRLYFQNGINFFGSPTTNLFRADLVRQRRDFYDRTLEPFEDVDVCLDLLRGAKFAFVHQVLSYSRSQSDSTLGRMRGYKWEEAHRFAELVRWGREYLEEEEYKRVYRDWSRTYREALADVIARGAPREFWQLHGKLMNAVGLELQWRQLAWPVMRWFLDRIGNPLRTAGNLLRRWSGGGRWRQKR